MWAIVEIGKKQFKVKKGDLLVVERLNQEGKVNFKNVLLVCKDNEVEIGTPYLEGVKVEAEILGEKKGQKVIIYKYKRRKKYRKKRGYRQALSLLKVSDIIKQK